LILGAAPKAGPIYGKGYSCCPRGARHNTTLLLQRLALPKEIEKKRKRKSRHLQPKTGIYTIAACVDRCGPCRAEEVAGEGNRLPKNRKDCRTCRNRAGEEARRERKRLKKETRARDSREGGAVNVVYLW